MGQSRKGAPIVMILVIIIACFLGFVIFQYLNNKTMEVAPANVSNITKIAPKGLTKADVQQIVKDYIYDHPDEIIKSVENMQRKGAEESQKNAEKLIQARIGEIEDTTNTPYAGNAQGDVKIVEFFDYSCGYCKAVHPELLQLLAEDKNVAIIYREFPILGPISEVASRYALAVYQIDKPKYVEFHNALMKAHLSTEANILEIAQSLGINSTKLKEEAAKPEIMAIIDKNRNLASDIAIHGTPAFIIGGELVPGAIDLPNIKAKIDALRKKPAEPKPSVMQRSGNAPAAPSAPASPATPSAP